MAGLSNANAALFTHVPEQIVKTWEPSFSTSGSSAAPASFVRVALSITFSPSPLQTDNLEPGDMANAWKQSLKLWESLDNEVTNVLNEKGPLCTQGGKHLQSVELKTDVSMVPSKAVLDMLMKPKRSELELPGDGMKSHRSKHRTR